MCYFTIHRLSSEGRFTLCMIQRTVNPDVTEMAKVLIHLHHISGPRVSCALGETHFSWSKDIRLEMTPNRHTSPFCCLQVRKNATRIRQTLASVNLTVGKWARELEGWRKFREGNRTLIWLVSKRLSQSREIKVLSREKTTQDWQKIKR